MIYIILICVFLFLMCSNYEYFGTGKSFARYYAPEKCDINNNCFKGSLWRSSIYQDVCQPSGKLNRVKKSLKSNCIKQL